MSVTDLPPELSVIMLLPDGYESRRRAISYLEKQSVRDKIELVLVAPAHLDIRVDARQIASFGSCQLLKSTEFLFPGQGFAAGVRGASAPLVAYVEEHSFPEAEWAQALIRAHAGPFAAVGCAIGNANPDTLCSWANLFEEFGPLVTPAASGEATYLGGHHTSYKRDVLLEYADALPNLLDNETALHIDLRARGHRLYLQGDAVSNHVNISQFRAYVRQDFVGQRSFAAVRANARQWSLSKRALYVLAAPLIPFVRLARVIKQMRRTGRAAQLLPQILSLLFPAIVCGTIGEIVGYVFGDSPSNIRTKAEAELDRARFLSSAEQRARTDGS